MRGDAKPDYRRAKVAALQQLAASGDAAAARELARRGVTAAIALDVTTLDYAALRALVLAWRDGIMPADRDRNRALAEQAQAELEARYRADAQVRRAWQDPAPTPPPAPPWTYPRAPRYQDWQRPMASTLYPSGADVQREQFGALAREVYAQRKAT